MKEQTLPESPATIPEQAKQQDQPLSRAEFDAGWESLLKTLQTYWAEQVYAPLRAYYESRIAPLQGSVSAEDYDQILACLRTLELSLRQWVERQKAPLWAATENHPKAVFQDRKDQLLTEFQNQWALRMADCVQSTTERMKQWVKTIHRQIQPPTDTTAQQLQVMKILSLKRDPEACGPEQAQVFNAAIDQLLTALRKNGSIDLKGPLAPVTDLQPYLNQAWERLVAAYNPVDIRLQAEAVFRTFYDALRADWATTEPLPLSDWVISTDQPYQLAKVLTAFDVRDSAERRQYVFDGPFRVMLQRCYAPHRITLELYLSTVFPALVQTWRTRDLDHLLGPPRLARLRANLDQVRAAYRNKFPLPPATPDAVVAWLNRALPLAQTRRQVTAAELEQA